MEQGTLFDIKQVERPAANKHFGGKHWLFNSLLNGCYIMERGGHSKTFTHCLFELNAVPVRKITRQQWKKIEVLVFEKKTRHASKYLIRLREVRALHGNSAYKRLYKKYKSAQKLSN